MFVWVQGGEEGVNRTNVPNEWNRQLTKLGTEMNREPNCLRPRKNSAEGELTPRISTSHGWEDLQVLFHARNVSTIAEEANA